MKIWCVFVPYFKKVYYIYKFFVSWVVVIFPLSFTKISEEVFTKKFWKISNNTNNYLWIWILFYIPNTVKFNFFIAWFKRFHLAIWCEVEDEHSWQRISNPPILWTPPRPPPRYCLTFFKKFDQPPSYHTQILKHTPILSFSFCCLVSLTEWVIVPHLMFYFS